MITGLILAAAIAAVAIAVRPGFGRLPRGERLERVRNSPNYRDGQFRNLDPSPLMAEARAACAACSNSCSERKRECVPTVP